MSIIHRAFYKETLRAAGAVLVVLVLLLLFIALARLLEQTAQGEYGLDAALILLSLETANRLDILLPLSLYLGVLSGLGRWYRDSEMVVLSACGLGLGSLLRPALLLAAFVALLTALSSMVFVPMSERLIQQTKVLASQKKDVSYVSPGTFRASESGDLVWYVEAVDRRAAVLAGVFIHVNRNNSEQLIWARGGEQYGDINTGDKFLALKAGRTYVYRGEQDDYQLTDFTEYHVRLEPAPVQSTHTSMKTIDNDELMRRGDFYAQAEWHWRLAKPLSVFVLVLFALVLAHTEIRQSRSGNFLLALLFYLVYSNVLGLGKSWIESGQLSAHWGLWPVHLFFLALAIFFFRRRVAHLPLLPGIK